ncbi:chemotaxis protein CheB [Pendulispora albinea]|uniref:histidine kinase n=1 Tax=Pendulispora albinea TaxID=2741071 RepID=A0ABZ2LQW7_9BACT
MDRSSPIVVGIGASAGGLEALESFFDNLPSNTGMAFVVVQHLSPDFKSLMDELLARHTELPICLVEDGMAIEPNHVYLIPPKKEMIVAEGKLLLSERDRQQELTLPIDVFFRSLAQDCGKRAVAIVLSGGGTDGSRGIRDVHEAGGLVIVQDVESAQFDGMPKTARDAGVAHWVLAPSEMPRVLIEHAAGHTPLLAPVSQIPAGTEEGLAAVYALLESQFQIDFKHYKPSTVTRRIERRLQLARAEHLDEYVERLKRERSELDVLYRDLLIGVTRFFRNEEAFDLLEQRVLPELLQRGPRDTPLRVWVAGCATGEEAYSLAIVLHELSNRFGNRAVKIFATDVHNGSLETAARALYDEEAVANVRADRLERYFLQRGKSFQVVPEVRQMIVFAQHNVIKDAPFTRVDLISCRNLLIYLQPQVQQKVLSLFHFGLNRGGVVFLGPSESPGPLVHDFQPVDRYWRIFQKYSDVRIPVEARLKPSKLADPPLSSGPHLAGFGRNSFSNLLGTYDALLDEFMPPSLLVSERGELLHSFSGASRFLKIHDGRQGLDIFDLVGSELKMVLVGGLKRAVHEASPIVFKGVQLDGGKEGPFKVTLRQIRNRTASLPNVLISFEAMDGPHEPRVADSPKEIDMGRASEARIAAMEAELSYTKENLQSAIEELETSNEELQAANEELLASNEELQSTNEELQSVNEELYTVNAEYQRKIGELTELTNDMDNLLSSTDVGTIFLDRDLKVRKFTPQIAEKFHLLPQDAGRSIETFTHDIDHPGLIEDLKHVLTTGERVERDLTAHRDNAFFLRILPYRAKGAVDGVVLTLIDVSGLKAAEDALFHERYLLESLLSSVPDAIYFKDSRGRFIRANKALAERLGRTNPREVVGKTLFEVSGPKDALGPPELDESVLRTGTAQHERLEKHPGTNGVDMWNLATRLPLRDRQRSIVGVIGIFRDVTERTHAEEKIQESVRRRDQFLAMLSHELRNPLSSIVITTSLLKQEDVDGEAGERDKLIEILDRQSQQMARLLDDLLDASRVTQNKITLRKRVVDLAAVAKDAADAVRSLMDARGVHFEVKIDPRPMNVDGDPARLQQIQVNLLSNAAKYTPHGGHVTFEVAPGSGAQAQKAIIRVRDDGVGIPCDMLETVFDLFVQSSRTLDRSDGGLGLGLTVVRSLVEMHGGTVTAHSEGEGKGCEFVVTFSLVAAPADKPRRSSFAGRSREDGSRPRVVIIEDNADSREMLSRVLELAGCECKSAEDGPSGIALIDAVGPDVAVVDVGLPGMDGFEIARRLRANPKYARTYLVALTGYGQGTDRAKAFEAGFDEHLVKPVRIDELLGLISRPNNSNNSNKKGSNGKVDGVQRLPVWRPEDQDG